MSTKKLQILGHLGEKIYKQNDEPTEVSDGTLWIDMDAEGTSGAGSVGTSVTLDATLTQAGQAADAKAVGDKFIEFEQKINSNVTISDDGNGNITFEIITPAISVTDDGDGNISIS